MFNNAFKEKKVLVTGHTGFKGAWLCAWLSSMGAKVTGFSNSVPTEPALFDVLGLGDLVNDIRGDVRDAPKVASLVEELRPDFIFHLAAQPIVKRSYEDPGETFGTNVLGTLNVLEGLRHLDAPCCAVMITSDKCYENVEWTWGYRENDRLGGKDPYSASKAAAECAIYSMHHSFFRDRDDIRIMSARAGNVIGGGDWAASRIVPDAMRAWSNGAPVVIRSPQSTRPWQHVLEPLSGYLRAGQMLSENAGLSGNAYNFGPRAEQSRTVMELLEVLSESWASSTDERIEVQPNPGFHEAGLLKLNCDKALHELCWEPTLEFVETAAFTSDWYLNFYRGQRSQMREFTLKQIQSYAAKAAERGHEWTK